MTVEEFRAVASEVFGFLEARGFRRARDLEQTTPTTGSVIYLGRNVGFVFSLDVRDQCVDGQVVRVVDGQLRRRWEGGYSCNVFTHLVKHEHYRGGRTGRGRDEDTESSIVRMVVGWAEMLREAGESLLSDRSDALP